MKVTKSPFRYLAVALAFLVGWVSAQYALPSITQFVKGYLTLGKGGGRSFPSFLKKDHTGKTYISVAIFGSGPAGASAAVYGARQKMLTVVFEGSRPGGLLTETSEVENWPGITKKTGGEIMDGVREQAKEFGAIFLDEEVTDIDVTSWPYKLTTSNEKVYYAFTVIIATGATHIKLGVPGEEEMFGSGVHTCARCDARFYKDKEVVIVGGGDSACEEATELANYASKVTMLIRKEKMRASAVMQERVKSNQKITIMYNVEVKKIVSQNGKVTGVTLMNNKTNQTADYPTNGVFLAIGHEPNTKLFKGKVAMDALGYITLQSKSQETSVSGIFAAGDCHDKRYRQAVTSSGYGAAAAIDAVTYLHGIDFHEKDLGAHLFSVQTE